MQGLKLYEFAYLKFLRKVIFEFLLLFIYQII